jgi:hypothetical protein
LRRWVQNLVGGRGVWAFALVAALLGGCAAGTQPHARVGPAAAARISLEPWEFEGQAGQKLITEHYVIHSTINDQQIVAGVAQVLEGALTQYRQLAPDVPLTQRPLECFLFANRQQWVRFTVEHTGEDATVYLQINRGGYTVGDWFVAYFLGDIGTYSVAAHEGFHQYLGRHLQQRIPPFLEEGLACMFEDVTWDGNLPRWDLTVNYGRQSALRQAVAEDRLLPLADLMNTHAGLVVNRSHEKIALFYAQCWAFARFMREAEGGRFQPALARMLADAAAGRLMGDEPPRKDKTLWSPRVAGPVLEAYLAMPMPQIERRYRAFLQHAAKE